MSILTMIFGNYSEKEIKRIKPIIDQINSLEDSIKVLSDDELKGKTEEFKNRLSNGETLDDILPEAFAVVREASKRVLGMRHFDVQLYGGIILHMGRISEMKTGEGKTLVSTAPAYLNALSGKGVHIVTVNDYLAKRDSEQMGQVHKFLGLTVGAVFHDSKPEERREAYACDITYATNNELGFDYLRDNMVVFEKDMVQRDLNYAIIDEVDSVLIDEARTPLIISGSGDKSTHLYKIADAFVKTLKQGKILNEDEALNPITREEIKEEGDFVVDEKAKTVSLTQEGVEKAEKFFAIENLSDPNSLEIQHHINNALKANYNMHLDKDYVVQNNEIIIVDEFTGRLMEGRRYSDGLHQAIEAKEGVKVNQESKTLATITFQNFFNKYKKKSGMTGTAMTEEGEFRQIYGMDVVAIPTNKPVIRVDHPDIVYKTENAKINAIVEDVKMSHDKGQPVLVGTINIDKSEKLSKELKKSGIKHQVINSKYHEKEAEIVELAGQEGAVTISTNMAGRGTDIKLDDNARKAGGLKIIGTERHESRRIDNQLRGRSGRQGDPGESCFYISLEDDLMRLFGSEKVMQMFDKVGMEENEPIQAKMLSKAIENAQKKVEGNNFSVRKHLLDYDQVMNEQREIIYSERMKVIKGEDVKSEILSMLRSVLDRMVDIYIEDETNRETWKLVELDKALKPIFNDDVVVLPGEGETQFKKDEFKQKLYDKALSIYEKKEEEFTSERMRELERIILIKVIDQRWTDHIDEMDRMRQGITLRAYGQRDPVIEYKFVSFEMFEELTNNIQLDTIKGLFNVRINLEPKMEQVETKMVTNMDDSMDKKPVVNKEPKIGRNAMCPCGSGLKYKNCHGKTV